MRTRMILCGAFFLLVPMMATAQAPDTAWTMLVNNSGTWVDKGCGTHDGGGVTVGIYTTLGKWDSWVVRFKPDGDTAWTRLIGGAYGDYGRDIVRLGDTGYVMLGKKQTVQYGDYYVWLVRIDTNGNTKWEKLMSRTENPWGLALATDTGFCIASSYESAVGTKNDIVIIRTSSTGDTVWTKRYGGAENDDPEAIVATPDSGFIIVANTYSYGPGNGDVYVLKVNKHGDTVWTRTFGGTEWDVAYDVEQTSDGNFIVVGGTYSLDPNGAMYAIKISSDGTTLWESYVGSAGGRAYDCVETPDGGFLLGGLTYPGTNNDMYLVRIDKDGKFLWEKRVGRGAHETGSFVKRLPDASTLLVGTYGGNSGMYVVKFMPEATGVDENGGVVPATFALRQNYPNPFNPTTTIVYTIGGVVALSGAHFSGDFPERSRGVEGRAYTNVRLVVYDILGREIAVLLNERKAPGSYSVEFDGSKIASGIYFYRLTAGALNLTRKMVLMR